MCNFCEKGEKVKLLMRTSYANSDDCIDICEAISPNENGYGSNCEGCNGCGDVSFYIGLKWDDYIYVEFYQKIKNVEISPISEGIKINYCPFCGRKLESK